MIAREGLHLIIIGFILTVGLLAVASRYDSKVAFGVSLVFGILTIFTTYFLRDPNRSAPDQTGVLLAPADGRILAIDTTSQCPYVGEKATKVSIFLSIFDVHVNRVPTRGRIDRVDYNRGRFFAAFKDKASMENEQTEIRMETPGGHRIVFKQIAGLIARRIACHLRAGQEVARGERFGIIRFGSRAELIVPVDCEIRARVGEHVKAGESVIGFLPVEPQAQRLENDARGRNVEI